MCKTTDHQRAPLARGWCAFVAVVAGLGLLLGCSADVPEVPKLDSDARVLAFGDSLTHGTGASSDASYPAVLARRIEREVVNAGKPGEQSAAGRERLPGVLAATEPDLLLLCHGGNDFLQDKNPEQIKSNLRAMIDQARDAGVSIVLIGVPGRTITMATSPLYGELATETGVPLVEDAVADILSEDALRSDRIHPNAAGYRRLASAVHDTLAQAGAVAAP